MTTIEKVALVFVAVLLPLFIVKAIRDVPQKEPSMYYNIVAFGDSLTFGFGAPPSQSYPALLSERLGVTVRNAGINGELSSEGLQRLPYVLEDAQPDLVILCHGGNDILQQRSLKGLEDNIEEMVQRILAYGSAVLLVAVPNLSLRGLDALPLYKRIAQWYDLLLEEDVLAYVLHHADLKSDMIHPNAKGCAKIAETLYRIIMKDSPR